MLEYDQGEWVWCPEVTKVDVFWPKVEKRSAFTFQVLPSINWEPSSSTQSSLELRRRATWFEMVEVGTVTNLLYFDSPRSKISRRLRSSAR